MANLIIKALHIIFMVSYFAGIFYLVRLLVYYKDTDAFPEPKQSILRTQYAYMAKRLWDIIILPAGVLMLVFGLCLIYLNPYLLKMPWFHLKLTFLVGLAAYHYWCWRQVQGLQNLKNETLNIANIKLRQANEVATFILFLVVFAVILKANALAYWWQLLLGFLGIVVLIMVTVKLVNKNKK